MKKIYVAGYNKCIKIWNDMAGSIDSLAIHGVPGMVFDYLSGEPSGTKEDEFTRMPFIRSFIETADYYYRIRSLPGPYPQELVPLLLFHEESERDELLQKQYTQFLRRIDLAAFMEKFSSDSWRISHCHMLDLSGIDKAVACRALHHFRSLGDLTLAPEGGCEILAEAREVGYSGPIRFHSVDFSSMSEEEFSHLCESLSGYNELDITGSTITQEQLTRLGSIPSLVSFTLDNTEITSLEFLIRRKGDLKKLSLNGCSKITDGEFMLLSGFTAMEYLSIQKTNAASYPFYEMAKGLPALVFLDITGCDRISDRVFSMDSFFLPQSVKTVKGAPDTWKKAPISGD